MSVSGLPARALRFSCSNLLIQRRNPLWSQEWRQSWRFCVSGEIAAFLTDVYNLLPKVEADGEHYHW